MPQDKFQVADWIVDVRALEISQGDETRRLEPRVMDLLVCLARRPGEVLMRQELEEMLWGRVIVGYDSLVRAVTKLRQAFDDDIHHPRIIETVPKVGYRLIADVRRLPGSAGSEVSAGSGAVGNDQPVDSSARVRPRLPIAVAASALTLIIASTISWHLWAPEYQRATTEHMAFPLPDEPSIAILPLTALGNDPGYEHLADAFTDLLITELSRFPELFVISRNSTLVYKHNAATVQQIAEQLGVRYLVEGSVQHWGNRLRVTIQLIDAIKGDHVWAERYDRNIEDLFTIQDEIVRTVVATVHGRVVDSEVKRIRELPPRFLDAYELTERAVELYKQWTEETVRAAQRVAERSLELDPTYLRTYKILTAIYRDGHRMGWLDMPREKAALLMRETAERAMRIDSSDYQAHWAMAVYYREAGDQQKALEEFEKAIDLNPNNALLLWSSADPLAFMGRFEESIGRYREAMRLNPHHPSWWNWNLAWAQYAAGHCEDALRSMQQMRPLPNMARKELAPVYVCLGEIDKARAVIDEFLKHEPDYTVDDYRRLFEKTSVPDEMRERNLEDLRTAGLPEAGSRHDQASDRLNGSNSEARSPN